jgi:hypothetical protein
MSSARTACTWSTIVMTSRPEIHPTHRNCVRVPTANGARLARPEAGIAVTPCIRLSGHHDANVIVGALRWPPRRRTAAA